MGTFRLPKFPWIPHGRPQSGIGTHAPGSMLCLCADVKEFARCALDGAYPASAAPCPPLPNATALGNGGRASTVPTATTNAYNEGDPRDRHSNDLDIRQVVQEEEGSNEDGLKTEAASSPS